MPTPTDNPLISLCNTDELDIAAIGDALADGADPNTIGWMRGFGYSDECTPLLAALTHRDPAPTRDLVRAFIRAGAAIDQRSPRRAYSALIIAAAWNHTAICSLLLELGADVHAMSTDPALGNALQACINANAAMCLPTVELLLAAGARVDDPGKMGDTAITKAIDAKNRPVLERLLQQSPTLDRWMGADQGSGETPFQRAVRRWPDVLERLVEAGADPNRPGRDGGGCFWAPVFDGDLARVDQLLALGADINGVDGRGRSVLFNRVDFPRRCDPAVIQGLVVRGANPRFAAPDGRSTLRAAVDRREVEVVQLLLSAGADPDAPDSSGETPRQHATDPLLAAAFGDNAPMTLTNVTGMAIGFLKNGLEMRHESGCWVAHDGTLREHGAAPIRRDRRASDTHAREVFGWILHHREPAAHALTDLIGRGMAVAGRPAPSLEELQSALRTHETALLRHLSLTITGADAGRAMAAAMRAGLRLDYGDRESWWRWTWNAATDRFRYEAGDHFGPEGDADDTMDTPAFERRWASGWTMAHGRLEGFKRRHLDDALRALGAPSLRAWVHRVPKGRATPDSPVPS